MKQPRFSIHDAFEEENDEAIRVYGSTVTSNISKPSCSGSGNSDTVVSSNKDVNECDPRFVFCNEVLLLLDFTIISTIFRNNKFGADDTTSRDSDSLIQEYINVPPSDLYTHCWNHPKIRENWRTVLAAVTLLIIGIVLVTMGMISIASPANGSRGFVFLLAGKLLFNLLQRLSIFHTNCFIFSQLFYVPWILFKSEFIHYYEQAAYALFLVPIMLFTFGLRLLVIVATISITYLCLLKLFCTKCYLVNSTHEYRDVLSQTFKTVK